MPLHVLSGSSGAWTRPDVVGWPVRTLLDGAVAGRVVALLATEDGVPRFLRMTTRDEEALLLPIGLARADAVRRRVWLPGMSRASLEALPRPRGDAVARETEEAVLDAVVAQAMGADAAPSAAAPAGGGGPPDAVRLVPLGRLPDLRVAAGDPDPRGWPVMDGEERVADVVELLVDPVARKARFLVCRPGSGTGGEQVALPVRTARIHPGRARVEVKGLTPAVLAALPVWRPDGGAERGPVPRYWRPHPGGPAFYEDPRFDPLAFFGPPPD